jgi:hypothetical protein
MSCKIRESQMGIHGEFMRREVSTGRDWGSLVFWTKHEYLPGAVKSYYLFSGTVVGFFALAAFIAGVVFLPSSHKNTWIPMIMILPVVGGFGIYMIVMTWFSDMGSRSVGVFENGLAIPKVELKTVQEKDRRYWFIRYDSVESVEIRVNPKAKPRPKKFIIVEGKKGLARDCAFYDSISQELEDIIGKELGHLMEERQ